MTKILVYCEHSKGTLKRSSIELLQAAKKSNATVAAVLFGPSESLINEAGAHGASECHTVKDDALSSYNPELYMLALKACADKFQPQIILASASSVGRDLFPRLAAQLQAGIASDCTELNFDGGNVKVKKPLYSGKCFAEVEFSNSTIKIIVMRANQLPVAPASAGSSPTVVEHALTKPNLKTLIKDVVKGTSEKLDLTEANIIVSGGRGLKEAGNFKLLNDLAETLGATVGASRAVVDAGWVSHGMQVGQTGKTVAPTLYIAVGISGAIQHLAGMSGSKVIVAINNDPNAPIFQKATYGIVGDLFQVVPALTEEFKKVLK